MAENIPEFGDYIEIEQKRFGCPNEMYVYKVIGTLNSNSWRDVPVRHDAPETLHNTCEDIVQAICCGIREEKVERFRIADVRITKRRFPGRTPQNCGEAVHQYRFFNSSAWYDGEISEKTCEVERLETRILYAQAAPAIGRECLQALRAYEQADHDGVMVRVSRQALDEVIEALSGAPAAVAPAQPAGGDQ